MPTAKPGKLRRRRCLNDNKLFQPKLSNHKFCCDPCRKEFHRHGSSFGPIKAGLYSAIDKKYAALEASIKLRFREAHNRMEILQGQIDMLGRLLKELRENYEGHQHISDAHSRYL